MIPESGIIEQALFYRNVGLSVIPVTGPHYTSARTHEERAKQSKAPLVQWIGYQSRFATDEEIESWFTKWPKANIGFVTGRISGVVVADFDSRDAVITAKQQGYLNTPCVRTGRGVHAYFQYPGGKVLKNFADTDAHMDFRADGGYIILPPSQHISGRLYEWVRDRTIGEMPFAPLPDSILKKALVGIMTGRLSRDEMRNLYRGRRKGDRNHTLARLCGSWVNDGLSPEEALEMAEAWNQGNQPPLAHDELVNTIKSIFRYRKKVRNPERDVFTEDFNVLRLSLLGNGIIGNTSSRRTWQVSWNDRAGGAGGSFDEAVFRAVSQIISGFPRPVHNPVSIRSLKQITDLLGIREAKIEDYRAVRQSLKRLVSMAVRSVYTGHDNNSNRKHIDSTFHVFDKVVFSTQTWNGETSHSTFIWLSDTYLKALGKGYGQAKPGS